MGHIEFPSQVACPHWKSNHRTKVFHKLSFCQESRQSHVLRSSCCFSVAQSCPTLCDPMDCSTPGFPVLHHLLELAQTHVHWVSDAIQPSHPLLPTSPLAFSLSQHQRLFQWVSSSHQVAKVLELQLQHQSFQRIFRVDFLKMDWLDLLVVQKTLKSPLQYHSSKQLP